jgi:hypothetical protein
MLMKLADLGHLSLQPDMHVAWSKRLQQESYLQARPG